MKKILVVAVVALFATTCGGSDNANGTDIADSPPESTTTTNPALAEMPEIEETDWVDMTGHDTVTIQARDNTFKEQFIRVSPGTKIVFDNKGRNPHNVLPVVEDAFPAVEVEDLQSGAVAAPVEFTDPGLFPYYCSLHGTKFAGMVGRIEVVDS